MKKFAFYILITFVLSGYSAFSQWKECNNGLNNSDIFWALAINGDNIFACTQNNGVFLSTDNGDSWIQKNSGLECINVYSLAISGNSIFAGTLDSGIYVSTDNGENWAHKNSDITNTHVKTIAINGNYIYASTSDGIYKSTDNGGNWTLCNPGLTPDYYVITLAASGENMFAGTDKRGVFLSTDQGDHWITKSSGILGRFGIFDQINSFAFIGNYIFAGGSGIYISSDNGDNWTSKSEVLNSQVLELAIIDNNIFAGCTDGVYFSTDNGDSWTQKSAGLTSNSIFSFAISSNYVFVGTYSGGVFKARISDLVPYIISVENEIEPMIFSQNPISDELIIHCENGIISHFEIINLLGIKVMTGEISGEYSTLDISHFPAGLYFLKVGNEVRKFVKE